MKGDRHTMKSLILTTQDARELDKLGGLTITKPIKPAPRYIEGASFSREADCADIWHLVGQDGNRLGAGDGVADVFASPVEVSDVVFIREPWYRLKNPQGGESERVILAADSVVQPEQAAYKWASPVSMPQDAARRFARVKSIEPAYGENVTPAWLIELVAITKEEATAEDGAPLSTSDVPEEASSYYAYTRSIPTTAPPSTQKIRLSTRSKATSPARRPISAPPSRTQRPRPRPSRNTPERNTPTFPRSSLARPTRSRPSATMTPSRQRSKSSPDTLSSTTRPTPPNLIPLLRRRTRRSDRLGSESVSIAGVSGA